MRTLAYSLLTDDDPTHIDAAALHEIVPIASIKTSGNIDPTVIPTPFISIRGLEESRAFRSRVRQGGVQLHVHDQPESYAQIDAIVKILARIMNAAAPKMWGDQWVMDIEDQGWSEDLYDDHYSTATRFGTYKVTVSALG